MMRTRKSIQKDTVDSSQNFFHLLYSPNGIDLIPLFHPLKNLDNKQASSHFIFPKRSKNRTLCRSQKAIYIYKSSKKKQRCSFLTSIYIKKRNSTVQKSSLESTHPPLRPSKILSFMFISAFDFICYLYEKKQPKKQVKIILFQESIRLCSVLCLTFDKLFSCIQKKK